MKHAMSQFLRGSPLFSLFLVLLCSCQTPPPPQTESQRLQVFFEQSFDEDLARSPQHMSYLSMKQQYDKLDDLSEQHAAASLELAKRQLEQLHRFAFEALDEQSQLSYKLFEKRARQRILDYDVRYYSYPVNQMFGLQSEFPSFMVNIHRIDTEKDAEDYIARLRAVRVQFAQLQEGLKKRAELKILAPKWVYPKVLDDCKNILKDYPFEEGKADSVLLDDFTKKVKALKVSDARKLELRTAAIEALTTAVGPAYRDLIQTVKELEQKAPEAVGMWNLPDGLKVYAQMLEETTTTQLSADEIHAIGLREVARIEGEMKALQKRLGIKGSLQNFLNSVRKNPKFYYPQSPEGKAAYLADNQKLLDAIRVRLPELFVTLPKDPLEVKPVEAYREKSAEVAFYSSPAPDGSRPGVYYVNLWDLKQVPKYKMEALAYHEGIPGHHLQLSISQQLKDLPRFRRFGGYTAYVEGWGLYAEQIPKDLGFYQDPYSDLGRLSMEMWRAARLVIDTGLHQKRWTREQSIAYLEEHTPADRGEIIKAVERYIVMPSQATAYMIGMLKIEELRSKAQTALGSRFDIRQFHEQIFKDGPLPLDLLESRVSTWIDQHK